MMERFWLSLLPSTDPVFEPLQRAESLTDPAEWPALALAHRQVVQEAMWGRSLAALAERAELLRESAVRLAERDDDGTDAAHVRSAELEALGYALGLTAVRAAVRQRDAQDMVVAS